MLLLMFVYLFSRFCSVLPFTFSSRHKKTKHLFYLDIWIGLLVFVSLRTFCYANNSNADVHPSICDDPALPIWKIRSINRQRRWRASVIMDHHKLSMFKRVIQLLKVYQKHEIAHILIIQRLSRPTNDHKINISPTQIHNFSLRTLLQNHKDKPNIMLKCWTCCCWISCTVHCSYWPDIFIFFFFYFLNMIFVCACQFGVSVLF